MTVLNDIRYAWRMLSKDRGVSILAIVMLALGIGAASAVFSVVDAVLLHPLPFRQPDRLVMLWENQLARGHGEVEISYPNFADWRRLNKTFEGMALLPSVNLDMAMIGSGAEPRQVAVCTVTGNFFDLIGARPALGRGFTKDEQRENIDAPVAIISDRLWKSHFGGRRDVIGSKVSIESSPIEIIGVMPADFDFPKGVEVWAPMQLMGGPESRGLRVFRAVGRLKPGVSVERARADMASVAAGLARQYPDANEGFGVTLIPLEESIFGDTSTALYVLLGSVILVLLIACVNVAHLLMARGAARRREIALRMSLGAGRGRIIRQLLTESLLLALAGGALGVVIALFGIDLLIALAPADLPRIGAVEADAGIVLVALALSTLTAVIFGAGPALQLSRGSTAGALKEGERSLAPGGSRGLRGALVAAEVALAVVLLVGAVLLIRSFMGLQSIDPGYRPEGVLTFRLPLQRSRYQTAAQQGAFFEKLLGSIERMPGVESAALVLMRPFSGTVGWDYPFSIEGQSAADQEANPYSNYEAVSPNYFRTMGIELVAGRDFTTHDRGEKGNVVIVNQTMARRYWPGADPIGRRLKFGGPDSPAPWMTVIGVARDVRYREWDTARPDIYAPYLRRAEYRTDFVVKTKGDPYALLPGIRAELARADREQPLTEAATMEEITSRALAAPRFTMLLVGIFAAIALLLAAAGVYGVMAYSVAQRTHEIGVRMALGAMPRNILMMIVRQAGGLILAGMIAGLAGAWGATRLLAAILYGVTPGDPASYLGAALALGVPALVACYLPALRATRIDPAIALRYE